MLGVLNLNKPSGPTSRDCVGKIERLVHPFKVGHAGTLDPIASGVLLILVGPAVRLMDEYHLLDKEYEGTFELGLTSPSADIETEVSTVEDAPRIERDQFSRACESFVGDILQTPPVFSAVWVGGRRAHSLARSGKQVEMPLRRVRIDSIEVTSFEYPRVSLRIVCGTGTYVRSIGRDIAKTFGSDAVLTSLVRTRIGPFRIEQSIATDARFTKLSVQKSINPPQDGLNFMPRLVLEDGLLERFRFGQHIELAHPMHEELQPHQRFIALDGDGSFHGIIGYDRANDVWKADKYLLQPNYLQQVASDALG